LIVHKHQPIKTAAMAGLWETTNGAPLLLFAIPNMAEQKNDFEIGIPKLESFINTHDWNGKMIGLKSVPRAEQPNIWWVFFTFRIMVGCGMAMIAVSALGTYLKRRYGSLSQCRRFLIMSMLSTPLGLIAMETGWFTAEIGRQPWLVYGVIKTSDYSAKVDPNQVLFSLLLMIVVYGIIFGYFYFFYLWKTIQHGPRFLSENEHELAFGYMDTFQTDHTPPKDRL